MSTITEYVDVVSVREAKEYLRIDDDITENDVEIEGLINSACSLIENTTQVFLKPQNITYFENSEPCIRVYAYPITAVVEPTEATDYDKTEKQLYSNYEILNSTVEKIVLTVGHSDTANIKPLFKTAIFETVRLWFYGSETETVNKGVIPNTVMAMISSEKRFIF